MRPLHLIFGILGVIAFVLSGQAMRHYHSPMDHLSGEVRMMYVSRHIYLLEASLVNVALGLYSQPRPGIWQRILQRIGSLLILVSPVLLTMAFLSEPALGLAGRSWRSFFGLIGLFTGVLAHLVASAGKKPSSEATP